MRFEVCPASFFVTRAELDATRRRMLIGDANRILTADDTRLSRWVRSISKATSARSYRYAYAFVFAIPLRADWNLHSARLSARLRMGCRAAKCQSRAAGQVTKNTLQRECKGQGAVGTLKAANLMVARAAPTVTMRCLDRSSGNPACPAAWWLLCHRFLLCLASFARQHVRSPVYVQDQDSLDTSI